MRKILSNGIKDASGAFVKIEEPKPRPYEPKSQDVSLDDVLEKQLLVLWRVTQQLLDKSVGPLTKDEIQNLATCIKVTVELKEREKDLLERMSPEELEKAYDNKARPTEEASEE